MEAFSELLCGVPQDNLFELKNVVNNMKVKLDLYTDKILEYDWTVENIDSEIPFYARNILETSLTILLGRSDPFRVITVYKVQSSPSYDIGKRSKSAIEWSGDIIAKSKGTNLWDFNNTKESFDRALLGNCQGEIIWKPGFSALSDYIESHEITSDWINEILGEDENSNFEKCKSLSSELFSAFSKGVHSESLVDISLMYDVVTVKTLIKDLFKLCSTLGLVSHFVGVMKPSVIVEDAIKKFSEMEAVINEL